MTFTAYRIKENINNGGLTIVPISSDRQVVVNGGKGNYVIGRIDGWGYTSSGWEEIEINEENFAEIVDEAIYKHPFALKLLPVGPWMKLGYEFEQKKLTNRIEQDRARLVELDQLLEGLK